MPRYIVRNQDQLWLVVDTQSETVVKKYSSDEAASEVAEMKNEDELNGTFA
jgi:hypothetical protein